MFRQEHGRAVAVLTRVFGDIDVAEDAVQDAFVAALEKWPASGMPPSPGAWIITTARNRAIDRLRRESARDDKYAQVALQHEREETIDEEDESAVRDDQLRLMFTCCHPALAPAVRVALTLRLIGGLTTTEIARAFLVPEATMSQRLVRAKSKIRDARIPYRIPAAAALPERVASVLAVLYLIFNEGYKASAGTQLVRDDLCREAMRLGRLLVELIPNEPEARGLLALMLLSESRRETRTTADGDLVLLADQDRSRWNRELIAEGQALVRQCLALNRPAYYQIQAAINAVHSEASSANETDWRQILALYDQLVTLTPNPVVALNRAVAMAEVEGAAAALDVVGRLELGELVSFHIVRADLLQRLGRSIEAVDALEAAITRSDNLAERRFLERRRRRLAAT